jgi:hypothetical protein
VYKIRVFGCSGRMWQHPLWLINLPVLTDKVNGSIL